MSERNRILVVDDDVDIRDILRTILEMDGYEVEGLDNGHTINDVIKTFQPKLILLDVMLGDMDGREICKLLKHAPETSAIPIVIISATHGLNKVNESLCRADDYIAKPFDIHELLSVIRLQVAA